MHYTEFSAPLSVYLGVTNVCNLRCIYCSAESGEAYPNELTTDEMFRLIDELHEAGVFEVTITGGEPLMRRDIFEVIGRLKGHGLTVEMISNAILITQRTAQRLAELDLHEIRISLDATSPDINDATRGENAFSGTYRGIRNLLDQGIRPGILVTVNRFNYNQLSNIAQTLKAENVKYVSFNMISAVGRGVCSYPVLTLDGQQLSEAVDSLRKLRADPEYSSFVGEDLLHWYKLPEKLESYKRALEKGAARRKANMLPCGAGKTMVSIQANGWVIPCNKFTGYRCGNIREDSFLNIWNNERTRRIRGLANKPVSEAHGCGSCDYNSICAGGCRAEAYLHYGDIEAPDPTCSVLPGSAVHQYQRQPLVQISPSRL
jgi:AdoMet-dependent heme synthase